jgi:hypothetical protein
MQLVAYGAQDIYLTGNPMITFFKTVYRRHTNFAMESIRQTFNGSVGFGSTVSATVSRNGDLISGAYLKVTLPQLTTAAAVAALADTAVNTIPSWVEAVGHYLVKRVDVEIGGQLIDRHYGDWLEIWSQLSIDKSHERAYNLMTGAEGSLQASPANTNLVAPGITIDARNRTVLHVPLQFWFCRNVGLSLPLIALQYHEVRITLEIEEQNNLCYVATNTASNAAATGDAISAATLSGDLSVELWVDYIYLDTDERRRFAQVSHEYLIEQLQFSGDEAFSGAAAGTNINQNITLNFNHPVKELVWASRMTSATSQKQFANYTTVRCLDTQTDSTHRNPTSALTGVSDTPMNLTATAQLQLNGHDRFAVQDGAYFSRLQTLNHHTRTAKSPGINVYSFALKPEDHQPSGTCNFSRIDNARLNLVINGTNTVGVQVNDTPDAIEQVAIAPAGVTKVFAVNYNVLRIMSGMGGLAYSN